MTVFAVNFAHPLGIDEKASDCTTVQGAEPIRWCIIPSLHAYLTNVRHVPPLSIEDERTLGWRIVNEGCLHSRTKLVRSNLRLVTAITEHFTGRGLAIADLIGEGNLALVRAADCFDPALGLRFSTSAGWWIKWSMKRAIEAATGPCEWRAPRGSERLPRSKARLHPA